MPIANASVVVNRRPEEVFAYLADVSRHGEWSPKPYRVEALTEGPVRVGSRFRSVGWLPRQPETVNEVEITQLDPPRRFAFNAHDRGETFKSEFVLTPQDGATRVDRTLDMPKPTGAVGVIFPLLLRVVVRPGVQKGMNLFKARLEEEPG